jgi:hypothetical protein
MNRRMIWIFRVIGLSLLLAVVAIGLNAHAGDKSGLLSSRYPMAKVKEVLIAPTAWHPYPRISDRDGWANLPEAVSAAQVKVAEKHLGAPWETPRASVFLDFVRNGDRSRYEAISFGRRVKLADLVVGECIENRGRFLDEIVDGIWTICEETYWGVPAHVGAQKRGNGLPDVTEPTVDLFAAETGMLMAWTDYLLGEKLDAISPLIRERIRHEVSRRILQPNLTRDDFWWMGISGRALNNWTPWICSNWLAAALLLESDADRRAGAVFKIMQCLDRFLSFYHEDGGCDEGPGYWDRAGGSLYDCLELLSSASQGKINVFSQPLVGEIGRYIARAYIHERWYINFADAAARLDPGASLIYRYGRAIGDPDLAGYGAFLARQQRLGEGAVRGSFGVLGRTLPALFQLRELGAAAPREPIFRDVWLPGLQVMSARSQAGSASGLYLAAKGGHNAESHNHNDVGNFIIYADGVPALIDIGVETYTAKTFSSRRYEIWTMQSSYHNLPAVNGVMQKDGRQFAARDVKYSATAMRADFSLDITGAYPPEAGIKSWVRTLAFERSGQVILRERFTLEKDRMPIVLSLMSCRRPEPARDGRIMLANLSPSETAAPLAITYDNSFFSARVETIPIEDGRLRSSWGNTLYRILLTAAAAPASGEYAVRIGR